MRLGLGLHVRFLKAMRAFSRRLRHRSRPVLAARSAERLHIGCGPQALAGWTNIDLEQHPGVDMVLDVRRGLPFRNVRYVFAEHFLEHLTYDEGYRFLKECRASLADGGVLRLSTPNLDWTVRTQYALIPAAAGREGVDACFAVNKAFRGWGHQFLYNAATLEATLLAAGFAEVRLRRYGESDDPVLAGLERHERSADSEDLPHVIVAEARGRGQISLQEVKDALDDFDQAVRG
ncbi:MAG TPA: hypothetical protein VGQ76_16795 [Thermoanaerobaculia bacterium]|nr:hypothetical protein [Thermoanaerobaculia bacterium]